MKKLLLLACSALMFSCVGKKDTRMATQQPAADSIRMFNLVNAHGLRASITNYGGKVVSLEVPDKNGKLGDVVLGYDSLDQYPGGNPYFGALIGRYGNRIAAGKFSIDGQAYQLVTNNGKNALHGGPKGFHNVMWQANQLNANTLELTYRSADGEEGYPGNLDAKVVYTLTDENELSIDYTATTDKPTIVNLTHHSFFNLAGAGEPSILKHELVINADRFCPVDEGLIPNSEPKLVQGTPFDFRTAHAIGERIDQKDEQLTFGKGYDHNWVLTKKENEFALAATITDPASGRIMEVWTTEPGLQFYSGNFLDGTDIGKGKKSYPYRSAFCLEAQHFPDSPNHPTFPSTVLRPGETYRQHTAYKFKTTK